MLARERLILENLTRVRAVALRVHRKIGGSAPLDDLVSAGYMGLISAVDHFDPRRNATLPTYAEHRIRGAILDSLRRADHVPANRRRKRRKLEAAVRRLQESLERSPEQQEIAQELGIDLAGFHAFKVACSFTMSSLDETAEGMTSTVLESMPAGLEQCPSQLLYRSELAQILAVAVGRLPQRQAQVLELLYWQELGLTGAAQLLGVRPSRVFQIRNAALARLRAEIGDCAHSSFTGDRPTEPLHERR